MLHYFSLVVAAAFRPTLDIAQTLLFIGILCVALLEHFGLRRSFAEMLSAGLSGRKVSLALVISIVGTRLLFAPYWVWQDERDAHLAAEEKIEALTNRELIKGQLLIFYEEGERLTNEGPGSREPEEYKKYQMETKQWADRVSQWMDENMARGASAKFKDYWPWLAKGYPGYAGASSQEVWDRNYVSFLCDNLDEMIKQNAWDKR
jgi:hypothetical protein